MLLFAMYYTKCCLGRSWARKIHYTINGVETVECHNPRPTQPTKNARTKYPKLEIRFPTVKKRIK